MASTSSAKSTAAEAGDFAVGCALLGFETVETHVRHILLKLGIGETPEYHRRVLAVLAYLRG